MRLEKACGVIAELWLNKQNSYDLHVSFQKDIVCEPLYPFKKSGQCIAINFQCKGRTELSIQISLYFTHLLNAPRRAITLQKSLAKMQGEGKSIIELI